LPEPERGQVIGVYEDSLGLLWQVSIAFAGVNFLVVLFEQRVPLRTDLDTEFGPESNKEGGSKNAAAAPDVEKGGAKDAVR
jgi:hypothetical protein